MSERHMSVPTPPVLDLDRLRDANFTIRAQGAKGPVLVHYDPARFTGGICYLVGEVWAIYGPLPFGEFVSSLGARDIHVPDSDDLARWVCACSGQAPREVH